MKRLSLKVFGINCIQQILPNIRIRSQFLILVSIIMILIVVTLLFWNIFQNSWLIQIFADGSQIIFQKESIKRIQLIMNTYKQYFDNIFALSGNSLIAFHKLYTVSKKQVELHSLDIDENYQMNYEGVKQIPDVVRFINKYNINSTNSFMCYSNVTSYENPMTLEEQIGVKLQEQIQAYGQLLFFGIEVLQLNIYSYIESDKINNIYPCINRGNGIYTYDPPNREWYLKLKETYDNTQQYSNYIYSVTSPFLLFTQQTLGVAITLPIVDQNLQFLGGVASSTLGTQLVQQLQNDKIDIKLIYLVSNTGILIMHPFDVDVSELPLYIYNESYTGFNYTDWIIITEGNYLLSNCQSIQFQIDILCLYNSKTQSDLIIGLENFTQYNMYLILLMSSKEYLQFSSEFQSSFQNEIQDLFILYMIILVTIFCFISSFIYGITKLIFYPIEKIEYFVNHQTQSNEYYSWHLPRFINIIMATEIRLLFITQQYLYRIIEYQAYHKSQQCFEIENIQYPADNLDITQYLIYNAKMQREWKSNSKVWNKFRNFITDFKIIQTIYNIILENLYKKQ